MELVFAIFSLIALIGCFVWFVFVVIDETKKQQQRDEWLKSIAKNVESLNSDWIMMAKIPSAKNDKEK